MFSKKIWGLLALSIAVAAGTAHATPFTKAALTGKYLFNVVGGTSGYNQDNLDTGDSDSASVNPDFIGSLALNGVITLNGSGGVTYADLRVAFGDTSEEDQVNCTPSFDTGSYTVNSDGTGTITLTFDTDDACLDGDTIIFNVTLSRNFSGDHQITTQSFHSSDTAEDTADFSSHCVNSPDHELTVGDETLFPLPACVDGVAMAGIMHHQ
jgi:hypothetical protein